MDRITIQSHFVPFYSFIIFPLSIFLFFAYHFVSDMTLINLVCDKIYIVHNKLLDLFLTFKYYQIFISPKSSRIFYFRIIDSTHLYLFLL